MFSRGFHDFCWAVERDLTDYRDNPHQDSGPLLEKISVLIKEFASSTWAGEEHTALAASASRITRDWTPSSTDGLPEEVAGVLCQILHLSAELQIGPPKQIESIPELERQGVPDKQICLIYGWMHGAEPDLERLRKARKTPDEVPSTHPTETVRRETIRRRKSEIDSLFLDLMQVAEQLASPPPGPEDTLQSLASQGVSGNQMAAILGKPLSQIHAELDHLGLSAPDSYDSAYSSRGKHDPDATDAEERIASSRYTVKVPDLTESERAFLLSLLSDGHKYATVVKKASAKGLKITVGALRVLHEEYANEKTPAQA